MEPYRLLTPVIGLLTACTTIDTTDLQSTEQLPTLPRQYQETPASGGSAEAITEKWWQSFGNQELDQLITLAAAQSFDMKAAIANVRLAEASVRLASASLWPELQADIEAGRNGFFEKDDDSSEYYAGLIASYELDFWGGVRANRTSAEALLAYSRFDRDILRLSITANVAFQWLQWVGTRERLHIAEQNLDTAQRLLGIIQLRVDAGAASELDIVQQQREVAGQQHIVARLHQQQRENRNILNLLLGRTEDLELHTTSLEALTAPTIDAGIPSMLLVRRPDIARAEAALRSADADITVARAAMLPAVNLGITISGSDGQISQILRDPIYTLVAGLTQPIFNGGALAAQLDAAVAIRDARMANYQQAIITAFADTLNALNTIAGIDAQRQAQQQQLVLARRAYALAESRYRAGAIALTTLLDSQADLFDAEDTHALLRQQSLQARVDLFRALGGGWTPQYLATNASNTEKNSSE